MNDPPGTIPPATTRLNTRRPPAHKSVSLRHSPPAAGPRPKENIARQPTTLSSPNPASDKANPPSVSPKLLSNKHSSGESSDAGRWFETTNNNAHQGNTSFVDNEPPFFLRNSSSSATPPEGYDVDGRKRSSISYRPNLVRIGTDGSSTEDFRSVIDDLTIANKRLKQRLRKYERQYDAHLQDEKLFEVRFHGLPDHKKKELEETLRKFAAGLDNGESTSLQNLSYAPTLEQQKTTSSTSRFADSGYVSMSASGQNSSAPSNQTSNPAEDRHKMSRSAYNRQQQNIQSYLHDIPVGLLPKSKAPMTEKSKKKLVVRRLEQIFAGKRSVPGTHPQPQQQEEVAQSAASADRQEREATGQQFRPEGARVARFMPGRGDQPDAGNEGEALQRLWTGLNVNENDLAGFNSPNQRPTRPLDLDLYRAQVPTENMDYIQHLGFTPPDMRTGLASEDGHGWLYLNLLINMAQLHTLNVTPDFVKDALHEYSGRLELSRDGRKVRWKGGLDVTKHISDTSSDQNNSNSPGDAGQYTSSPSKRLKTDHSTSTDEAQLDPEVRARRISRAQREREQKQFAYTPMFFHKEETDEEADSYGFDVESSGNSLQPPKPAGNSSGFGSSAMQSGSSTKKRVHEDGPLIFYNKAKFCTDLSGDRLGGSAMAPGAYDPVTSHPLGIADDPTARAQVDSDTAEPRGLSNPTLMDLDSKNGSRTTSDDEMFGFTPNIMGVGSGDDSPPIIEFEASGVGGVQPEDNFSISVRRAQTQTVPSGPVGRRRSTLYPAKIRDVLSEPESPASDPVSPTSPHHIIKEEILSASRRYLPNSALPPASFLPFDSTSSGDVDSDLDSDLGSDEASSEGEEEDDSESGQGPATAMQLLNISPFHAPHTIGMSDDEEASEYSDDSDDGSIDLLATARLIDPNTVRSREREYDAAVADRLAEEIVAGSSAATAGGGSGFNSPVESNIVAPELKNKRDMSITSGSISSRSKLKRGRTSDSLAIKEGKKSKSQHDGD